MVVYVCPEADFQTAWTMSSSTEKFQKTLVFQPSKGDFEVRFCSCRVMLCFSIGILQGWGTGQGDWALVWLFWTGQVTQRKDVRVDVLGQVKHPSSLLPRL